MCSVVSARKAATEYSDDGEAASFLELEAAAVADADAALFLAAAEEDGEDFCLEAERKERREERVKKMRGAAEDEVRREVDDVADEVEDAAAAAVVVEERREVAGSRELWRWRRFESISMNVSSILILNE